MAMIGTHTSIPLSRLKRRHQPSLSNTVQSHGSSAMERQHHLTGKIIGSDGSILVTYQTILHSNRLNVFKTHLLT